MTSFLKCTPFGTSLLFPNRLGLTEKMLSYLLLIVISKGWCTFSWLSLHLLSPYVPLFFIAIPCPLWNKLFLSCYQKRLVLVLSKLIMWTLFLPLLRTGHHSPSGPLPASTVRIGAFLPHISWSIALFEPADTATNLVLVICNRIVFAIHPAHPPIATPLAVALPGEVFIVPATSLITLLLLLPGISLITLLLLLPGISLITLTLPPLQGSLSHLLHLPLTFLQRM